MKKHFILLLIIATALVLTGCHKGQDTPEQVHTIPVIRIDLDEGVEGLEKVNASTDHSYECAGSLTVIMPDGDQIQDLTLEYFRGRGNSTWLADKKPYKIKFEDKQDLFGLGENKHYVLLANVYDRTFLKNRLTFYIAERMGMEFVPQGVNVDLYVSGEYLGNYLLCEQIRIGESRIEIDELEEETGTPEIWGGYLLSFSPWEGLEEENIFKTSRGVPFYNDTPGFVPTDKDCGPDEQKEYIRDYIQRCEDAIFDGDYGSIDELIDLQSAADYWLIQEFCQNADAFNTPSSYAYKKRYESNGTEGKLYFGPLWDFDRAWGDTGFFSSDPAYFNHVTHPWINELRDREEFTQLLKERWTVLDSVLEEIFADGGVYDLWVSENKDSFTTDGEKWQEFYRESDPSGSENYVDYCNGLKEWINARRKWINENLDDIGNILVRVTIRSDISEEKTIKIQVGSFLFAELEAEEADGYVFEGWYDEEGNILPDNATANDDMIVYAKYRKE